MYNDRLKGLACSNRGYYSKILYFGQIEAALQRLVQVSIDDAVFFFILLYFNESNINCLGIYSVSSFYGNRF